MNPDQDRGVVEKYFDVVMRYDPRRKIVWREIAKFVQRFISADAAVLELGAGYCDFINHIVCGRKYVLDINPNVGKYADGSVEIVIGSCLELEKVRTSRLDVIFASHLLEHLERREIITLLRKCKERLQGGGKLILLQPNYRYAYREYFDDYTHVTPLDHMSLGQMLEVCGFTIVTMQPRFLPYSMNSGLPTTSWMVYLYLRLPFKIFAKQMFCVAEA